MSPKQDRISGNMNWPNTSYLSRDNWFIFDTGCQEITDKSLKSLLHCAVAAYKTTGITKKTTEDKAASIILPQWSPCCNLHWSAVCSSGPTGLTQHYISDILKIFSWLYTLQLTLSGLTQPFRTLLPNTCSCSSKDKLCFQLLRFSKIIFFPLHILW